METRSRVPMSGSCRCVVLAQWFSTRRSQDLRDGGETRAEVESRRYTHISRFLSRSSCRSVFFSGPLRLSLLRQQLLVVFTGCLDRSAATGLRGHGWKFRRRSNPQLGGSRERQGSLSRAGWHRWRLGGKYRTNLPRRHIPLSAQPLRAPTRR